MLPIDSVIMIGLLKYDQNPRGLSLREGDLVFDVETETVAVVKAAYGRCVTINFSGNLKVAVPITRLRRLTMSLETFSLN